MKQLRLKDLYEECKKQMWKGNGNKIIVCGNDNEGNGYSKRGNKIAYIQLTWLGDHTDGYDEAPMPEVISKIRSGIDYIIPAETEFVNGYTRFRHGDIRITKEAVEDAFMRLADELEKSINK